MSHFGVLVVGVMAFCVRKNGNEYRQNEGENVGFHGCGLGSVEYDFAAAFAV